jgi:hypothetical protein
MTLNRPNRHGSLLAPGLWFVVSALFLVSAGGIAIVVLAQGRFADLEVAGHALVFAVMATLAGCRAMNKGKAGTAP